MSEPLAMWVVYDHPTDFPDGYVARKWLNDKPTGDTMAAESVEALRHVLAARGYTCLPRHETDDAVIMETWL